MIKSNPQISYATKKRGDGYRQMNETSLTLEEFIYIKVPEAKS